MDFVVAQDPMDTFLQVCKCAWDDLGPDTRLDVRATCRDGRRLHDSKLDMLNPLLLEQLYDDNGVAVGVKPRAPSQLRRFVSGMLQRGAKPHCLELLFYSGCFGDDRSERAALWPPKEVETQLRAVLDACSSYPVRALKLYGGVPYSKATSEAVAAFCPHLRDLELHYGGNDLPRHRSKEKYAAGVTSLLEVVGPKLGRLAVTSWTREDWPSGGASALQGCTALSSLEFNAISGGMAMEARMFTTLSSLIQLRTLRLALYGFSATSSPDTFRPHATCVAHLSTLTALTSLHLELPSCYEPAGDSWWRQQADGREHEAWEEVREVHRASLLSALRAMPQLQHLYCFRLWLRASEAASLTALTSLTLGGLLPPPQLQQQQPVTDSLAGASAAGGLPPHLCTLTLTGGISPKVLAALHPPPSLTQLDASRIRFGTSDVSPGCRMQPVVMKDVRTAAVLLGRLMAGTCHKEITFKADCGMEQLRAPWVAGHVEWIRGLAPLGTWLEGLKLERVRLQHADVVCLVSTLPMLRALELAENSVPLISLDILTGLTGLETLKLDLEDHDGLTTEVLAAVLRQLCRGIGSLRTVTVSAASSELCASACKQSVVEQLAGRGIRAPAIHISNDESDSDGGGGRDDSDDSGTESDDD